MNLYIFNKSSIAAAFGVGTYIHELTEALRYSNINVCVINIWSDKPQIQSEEINGINHWYFPEPLREQRTTDQQKQLDLYHRNIVYLLQLLIKDKKKLIFHLNYLDCKPMADSLKAVFNCRIITSIHYFNWCFTLFGNVTRFRKIITSKDNDPFNNKIEKLYREDKELLKTVDHVICLSESTRNLLTDYYQVEQNKITLIYNYVSDSASDKDQLKLRHKYHIPDVPIIIFAGRIDDIKGLEYALRAFKIVLALHTHCHFIIAGDGMFREYMQECEDIWTYITWTGLINRDKLYDLYAIADIGIMPSFHEQCSFVAIEMMMHGIPIIGSTSTGLKEMIIDGETGLHIPVIECDDRAEMDTDLLAEKMLYLLQHPNETKKMGQNARRRYLEIYSSEIFRKNMLNEYKSIWAATGK